MNNLKIAFFTEAGSSRGMGHLVRCYTIYNKFKKVYSETSFFLDSDLNFDYKFDDLIYFSWEDFAFETIFYDIVFIDSYEADLNIYEQITQNSKLAVFIDDFGRLQYPKGAIINFAPDSELLFYTEKKDIHHYFLGLEYLPIREQFKEHQIKSNSQLFIMLGGNDTKDLSYHILQAIDTIDIKKVLVFNNSNEIDKFKKFNNLNILHKPDDSLLIENMKKSSLAICTASMSLYELSFLQIPTLIIAVSQNQVIGATQSIKHNIASSFVNIESNNWKNQLLQETNQLLQKNLPISSKIDGLGCKRILDNITKLVA